MVGRQFDDLTDVEKLKARKVTKFIARSIEPDLVAAVRSERRVITTPEELDRLPRESVVACLAGERAADRSFPARHPWRVPGRLVQPGRSRLD